MGNLFSFDFFDFGFPFLPSPPPPSPTPRPTPFPTRAPTPFPTGAGGNIIATQLGACLTTDTTRFNLCLDLLVSENAVPVFLEAKELWETVNVGDVGPTPDQRFYNFDPETVANSDTFLNIQPLTVDDLYVSAQEMFMDGVGGVLGAAGPTFIETQGDRPLAAITEFDAADVANLLVNDRRGLLNTITHEIGHCQGIGTAVSDFQTWMRARSGHISNILWCRYSGNSPDNSSSASKLSSIRERAPMLCGEESVLMEETLYPFKLPAALVPSLDTGMRTAWGQNS